mgnify:CR=1 FL=1
MGWQEVSVAASEDVTSKLRAGDILVRDAGGGANGHMNIIASVDDGKILAYDAGSESNWNTSNAKAGKPAHIIAKMIIVQEKLLGFLMLVEVVVNQLTLVKL